MHHLKKHKAILVLVLFFIAFLIFRDLKPWSGEMPLFHDKTQAVRVAEFSKSIESGHIPPRISTVFSFGMGYPVFNFYAPTSYWITSFIHLAGFDAVDALKLSFGLAVLSAFMAMYAFSRQHMGKYTAMTAALLYALSPYYAVEIFVRGNLAESWLLVFFPLTLYALERLIATDDVRWFFGYAVSFSLMMTSHNALSMVAVAFVGVYALVRPGFVRRTFSTFKATVAGVLLSSYFFVPAIFELQSTYARAVAVLSKFSDHLLCLNQVWHGAWGYGGSQPGCVDGMSFQIGKIAIVFGSMGILYVIVRSLKKRRPRKDAHILLLVFLTVFALYLAISQSEPIWYALSKVLSLFQFPWRFLLFVQFGLAFFAGYFLHAIVKKPKHALLIFVLITGAQMYQVKDEFRGNMMAADEYKNKYVSEKFMRDNLVYGIPEYVPKTVDIVEYYSFQDMTELVRSEGLLEGVDDVYEWEDNGFSKSATTTAEDFEINIHYQPYWHIELNGEEFIPDTVDKLGRPVVTGRTGETDVHIQYQQTPIQMTGNAISLLTLLGIVVPLKKYHGKKHSKKKKHR